MIDNTLEKEDVLLAKLKRLKRMNGDFGEGYYRKDAVHPLEVEIASLKKNCMMTTLLEEAYLLEEFLFEIRNSKFFTVAHVELLRELREAFLDVHSEIYNLFREEL